MLRRAVDTVTELLPALRIHRVQMNVIQRRVILTNLSKTNHVGLSLFVLQGKKSYGQVRSNRYHVATGSITIPL